MRKNNKETLCIFLAIAVSLVGFYIAEKMIVVAGDESINFRELFLFDVIEKAFKKCKEQD